MSQTRRKISVFVALAVVFWGCSRSPEQNFQQGIALYQQGNFSKAADVLEQALTKAPPTAQALTFLGVCFAKTGKPDAASRRFNEAIKLDPNYIPARYNLAVLLLEHGQFESAANLLRQIHQHPSAPRDTGAYLALACNNLAVMAARQRDFPRAEKLLREALAVAPQSPEPAQNLAALKTRVEPPKSAVLPATVTAVATSAAPSHVAVTNMAVEPPKPVATTTTTTPPPASAVQTVAAATNSTLKPSVAVSAPVVKRRAALAPRALSHGDRAQAMIHFNEAVILHQQGRLSDVPALYAKAIAADPSFAQAYYNLAIAYRDLKQTDRALENYELALMADPKFHDARLNYAILLQQQGYTADALDQYEKFLQDNPSNAAVHVTVAGLYATDRATLARARAHYEAYLKLVPNAPHATEIRRWLEQHQ